MFPGYFLGNETRITMLCVSHIGEHISLGTIGLCVFYAGKDITRDMCFTARGTNITRVLCFPGRGTEWIFVVNVTCVA